MNSVVKLNTLAELDVGGGEKPDISVQIESAIQSGRILWEMNDQTTSIGVFSDLVTKYKKESGISLDRAGLLSVLSYWSSRARHQDQQYILEHYLEPAVKFINSNECRNRGLVFHNFATFCDEGYNNPASMSALESASKLKDQKEREVSALRALKYDKRLDKSEVTDIAKQLEKARRMLERDETEYQRLKDVRNKLLYNCVQYYLRSIVESDEYHGDESRFCAIWLANSGERRVNDLVKKYVSKVPTLKLVPWVNQLSSRLNKSDSTSFQDGLGELLARMCEDHPFHCLYQIMALRRTSTEEDIELDKKHATKSRARKASRGGTAMTASTSGQNNSQSNAANEFWDLLKNRGVLPEAVLSGVEAFCREARILAEAVYDPNSRGSLLLSQLKYRTSEDAAPGNKQKVARDTNWGKRATIDSAFWTSNLYRLQIPSPTLNIDCRPSCDYSDVPKMKVAKPKVTIASGLSAPKIVTLQSTNGAEYKVLFKGGDDLRQDAIMEQVFSQANDFFKDDESTRKRNLNVRTYKVVPLDSQNGIIEFVSNTKALQDVLAPLHERIHPNGLKIREARRKLGEARSFSDEERLDVYKDIERQFPPVLAHFFFETFLSPDEWFEARVNYSRSTAAISILGYVLGVGDRHCNNILMDSKTGEVVHIDLGIAFDQGKLLPMPETVPFRLSRDVVDGMGVTGVEGVFRRCCEFSLAVLRKEKSSISTILNVLRYDPLHNWTLSPLKKRKLQDVEASKTTTTAAAAATATNGAQAQSKREDGEADRALTIVQSKLSDHLSVEATVRELIHEASSSRNLAMLFTGWQPFC